MDVIDPFTQYQIKKYDSQNCNGVVKKWLSEMRSGFGFYPLCEFAEIIKQSADILLNGAPKGRYFVNRSPK